MKSTASAFTCLSFAYLGNHQDAEEVLQEVFVKAMSAEAQKNEQAWLYTVARNLSLNRIRAHKNVIRKKFQLINEPSTEQGLSEQNPEWLEKEVATLSSGLREVFKLRSAGMTYEQIASHLELPVGTVKSRIHELVSQLQEKWKLWNVN